VLERGGGCQLRDAGFPRRGGECSRWEQRGEGWAADGCTSITQGTQAPARPGAVRFVAARSCPAAFSHPESAPLTAGCMPHLRRATLLHRPTCGRLACRPGSACVKVTLRAPVNLRHPMVNAPGRLPLDAETARTYAVTLRLKHPESVLCTFYGITQKLSTTGGQSVRTRSDTNALKRHLARVHS
jgi:hypothetical protein